MSTGETTLQRKRQKYFIDAKWQLSVSAGLAGVALLAGLAQMLGTLALADRDPIEQLSGEQIGMMAFAINGLFFLLLLGGLTVLSVRMTHSVAGPAMIIERAVKAIHEGRFDSRLDLRSGDYLKSLAAAVKALSDQVQARNERHTRLCRELEEALAGSDLGAARAIAQQLGDGDDVASQEPQRAAAA